MLYLIVIVLIAIPFVVSHQVEQWHEPLPQQTGNEESLFPMKAGISLLLILITMKMFQLSNGVIVRQPILKQNP